MNLTRRLGPNTRIVLHQPAQSQNPALRDLLSALRNTSAGNLIAAAPNWVGENAPDVIAGGLLEASMETFAIKPIHNISDRIAQH